MSEVTKSQEGALRVVVTGGGSSGHVTPALAVIERGLDRGWSVDYIGSNTGIERALVEAAHLRYHSIPVGKLRRYFSLQNFVDPLFVVAGMLQATLLVRKLRPQVVFSKGGFVSFPVVFGAWVNRVPVVAHESDTTPGLANRMSMPFVRVLCVANGETRNHVPRSLRVEETGTPLRKALFEGNRERGMQEFGLDPKLRTLLVFGGSLGASTINEAVRALLPDLGEDTQVIHVCGKGKLDPTLAGLPRYRQYEYMQDEFPDALACADLVVCRAGANSIAELIALAIPTIVVPLAAAQSRGDQLENADRFVAAGFGWKIPDEELAASTLAEAITTGFSQREGVIEAMAASSEGHAAERIVAILEAQVT